MASSLDYTEGFKCYKSVTKLSRQTSQSQKQTLVFWFISQGNEYDGTKSFSCEFVWFESAPELCALYVEKIRLLSLKH